VLSSPLRSRDFSLALLSAELWLPFPVCRAASSSSRWDISGLVLMVDSFDSLDRAWGIALDVSFVVVACRAALAFASSAR